MARNHRTMTTVVATKVVRETEVVRARRGPIIIISLFSGETTRETSVERRLPACRKYDRVHSMTEDTLSRVSVVQIAYPL